MGLVSKRVRSTLIAGGLAVGSWTLLLDSRARESVRRAVKVTGGLAKHLLSEYMDPLASYSAEEADEYNRSWVEQQWKNIGY